MFKVSGVRIGIFGATGMVGREILSVLEKTKFPVSNLRLFASENSVGKVLSTYKGDIVVENANDVEYNDFDTVFWAIGGGWPKDNLEKLNNSKCVAIDSSSTFRYDKDVPLVIPQINADSIRDSNLIANPNCTTAIAIIPLKVISDKYGLRKVIISTYQATSGAGIFGMRELEEETRNALLGKSVKNETFVHPIVFNVIPHIDGFEENDYTREEMKVVWETRKILGNDSLDISCTCVRIPTLRAHSESIVVETQKEIDINELRELIHNTNGLELVDDIENNKYPMPISATRKYDVEVGRLRHNLVFGKNSVEFFVCGDQILRGAALNAVEIARVVYDKRFK